MSDVKLALHPSFMTFQKNLAFAIFNAYKDQTSFLIWDGNTPLICNAQMSLQILNIFYYFHQQGQNWSRLWIKSITNVRFYILQMKMFWKLPYISLLPQLDTCSKYCNTMSFPTYRYPLDTDCNYTILATFSNH